MPSGITRQRLDCLLRSRIGFRVGVAMAALLLGCTSLQNAVADGETRTLSFHHLHTGENITVTFKRDGRYAEAALKKINWFMRDWRREEDTRMDPHLLDLLWEVYRDVDAKDPIQIVCGYRAPQTNAMLRARSTGVARFSQHTLGNAIDFYIPGVSLEQVRVAGLRMQRGGVGFYPTSGSPFVHMDTGGVRMWPRMTREQLVRVFPDGRTVLIPSDGKPLRGYALALADIKQRGARPSGLSLATAERTGAISDTQRVAAAEESSKPNLLAALFGTRDNARDADEETDARSAAAEPQAKRVKPIRIAANVARPKGRPAKSTPAPAPKLVYAEPASEPAPPRKPAPTVVASAAPTPNDIIRARGYWRGLIEADGADASPAGKAGAIAAKARIGLAMAAFDPQPTGSLPPVMNPSAGETPPAGGMTLAYAPASGPGAQPSRTTVSDRDAMTIAFKRHAARIVAMHNAWMAPSPAAPMQVAQGPASFAERFENPWLTAVAMTPSARSFLSTTLLGEPDYATLRVFLAAPTHAVQMAFTDDPNGGMSAERFSGHAIVFLGTMNFAADDRGLTQTASLR